MDTQFASPQRASKEELSKEIKHTKDLPLIKELTYMVADAFMILNQHRQIIYCNNTLLEILGIKDPSEIYGLRPGEALHCIHSDETEGGCGTTESCKQCGAVNAIVNSQKQENTLQEEECRVVAKDGTTSLDFIVRAKTKTLLLSNKVFTLFIVRDNAAEKRKQVLERTFFHDILNTAGGIQGLADLIQDPSEDEREKYIDLLQSSSHTLVEEINAQKDILAAENENLEIEMSPLDSTDILSSIIAVYQGHQVTKGKTLKIAEDCASIDFVSDPRLLRRVVGNMTKNALEAESQGQTITIGAEPVQKGIKFWVQNPAVMPDDIKVQIFQRSFSTKGSGRGIGTYSIKLLGEKYLKGNVTFTSDEKTGTIFQIVLPTN
ncbi:MAG: PAS domain-containing sensor histidine kinase [Thermodesulfobacteriota bacterium]|nr:PAS domain-containing sensor histidine kinase [Thermodesulfobacteriota bacterium]